MCYINGIRVSREAYIQYKQAQKELKELQKNLFNQPARRGFDYSDWPVIKPSADGMDWNITGMSWGFLPDSIKTAAQAQDFRYGFRDAYNRFTEPCTTLLARGEDILLHGKMFRKSALQKRCLVLSSGFYEHRHIHLTGKQGNALKATAKYPYRITVQEKEVFFMAGIYNTFLDDESGEMIDTVALITTDATGHGMMEKIHNVKKRMPVILTDKLAEEWTNPSLSEQRITQLATYQFPASRMSAYTVSKDFLTSADPTAAFHYPELIKAAA